VTPLLVLVAWLRNRTADPKTVGQDDVLVPRLLRAVIGLAGVVNLGFALLLLALPEVMMGNWPWQLTPLTARVLGGWFALPGIVGLVVAIDGRWSASRIVLQSQLLGIVLILGATTRAWSEFNPAAAGPWAFASGMIALLVIVVMLYVGMELRWWGTLDRRNVLAGSRPSQESSRSTLPG
jgi:hypothetical protein